MLAAEAVQFLYRSFLGCMVCVQLSDMFPEAELLEAAGQTRVVGSS